MANAPKDEWFRLEVDKRSHFESHITSVECTDAATGDTFYTIAAPEKRGDDNSKHFIVFAEDDFKGVPHELEATNRCVKLDAPIYKNLHSYGVAGQVCYFMDTDTCDGKVLIKADAQGTEVWGRVDVGGVNGFAARITSVYCGHLALSEAVSTATTTTPAKRGPPLGPGQMRLFENTDQSGHNETLLADRICVKVPDTVSHKVRRIIQISGRKCRYYDSSCEEKQVFEIDSWNTPVRRNIDAQYGDKIGFVMCKIKWDTTHDAVPIESRAEDVAASNVGDVHACKYNRKRESCQDLNALGSCKAFNDNLSQQIDTLRQGGGSECEYWRNKDCSSLILTSISGANDYSPNLGPGNRDGKEISAVSCKHMHVPKKVGFGTTIHNDEGYTIHASPSKRETAQAGQVLVAAQPHLRGMTRLVDTTKDNNNCVPLTNQFFWHLESFRQYRGSVCSYWQYNCGDLLPNNKPIFTIDSRKQDYVVDFVPQMLGPNRNKVGYIRCLNAAAAEEYMASVDAEDPTVFSTGESLPITTTTGLSPRTLRRV
jgi:hypothetical protein